MLPLDIRNLIMKFVYDIVLDIDLKQLKPGPNNIILQKKPRELMQWELGLWGNSA